MSLVECVPNVSEGRKISVIEELAAVIRQQAATQLLHVDPGADANRTVFTFAVRVEDALSASMAFIETALKRIDMRAHHGEHERNGAVDVFPFIPLGNTSMKTCIELAETLGARVGRELEIPVYLYGRAAKQPQRESLAVLRHGQYESLQQRLSEPRWLPDAGPARWSDTIARGGSIQIGARPFLIAWNINLETRDARIASKIAARIRTSGDGKECAGMFPELKARGWYMAQFGCAQVTMNLTDYSVTPLHSVFTAVSDMAREFDTRVTGSELVGLIPRDALLAAGRYFARTEELTEHALIETAVDALGLSQLSPFLPGKRILEQCLEN